MNICLRAWMAFGARRDAWITVSRGYVFTSALSCILFSGFSLWSLDASASAIPIVNITCSECTTQSTLQIAANTYVSTWYGKTPPGYTGTVAAAGECSSGQGSGTIIEVANTAVPIFGAFFVCIELEQLQGPGTPYYPVPTTASGTIPGASGAINPKYVVLGVDYAPPGARSNVNYAGSSMRGTSTSSEQTFKNTVSVSVEGDAGANLFGIVSGGSDVTFSAEYSGETDSSSSITLQTTTSDGDIINGPSTSSVGIDHDADVIWLWLNPQVPFTVFAPNQLQQGQYTINPLDPAGEMDIMAVYVSWLKHPSTIPNNVAAVLARSWDTSGVGGLNASDYATILAQDPLASGTYNPNTDAGHRFDLQTDHVFNYEPAPSGAAPITETYSVAAQSTSSQGQSATTSYTVGESISLNSKITFIADFASNVKISDSYTVTSKWSSVINSSTTKTASLSITGPAYSDNYTGPVEMQVWRDNIYGSYMFFPVN